MEKKTFNPSQHLTKVKGQDYLETKYRLQWFRNEHPDGVIETEMVQTGHNDIAAFRAKVSIPGGGSATGYGTCQFSTFDSPYEKGETKAIGRALAALGFGTQFAGDDFAEAGNIVDSPVGQQQRPPQQQRPQGQAFSGNQGANEQVAQQYQPNTPPEPPVGFGDPPQQQQTSFGGGQRSQGPRQGYGGGGSGGPSEGQFTFATDLLNRKVPPQEQGKAVAAFNDGNVELRDISKGNISQLIDHLKTLPDLPGTPRYSR